jgi:hypothetical protein
MPGYKPASDALPAERLFSTQTTTKKDIEDKKDGGSDKDKKPGIFASLWRELAGS